ncbi:P2 family phage major capsid protein, partial [Yersinia entomophaga]|uniref:P2 family phage major capsid protein n=3 Tax=Yersinia TaxID=629 RepID=UPI0039F0F772
MLSDSIAGRPAMVPPFMPGKRMTVTTLANLHIYTQRGTRQRKAEFVEDRKQFENKYLRNEGYAVEYPELYAAIDESAVTIGEVKEPSDPKVGE